MLLVETELTSFLAFKSASGKGSRMRALRKVPQAGCGTCGLCCVRMRVRVRASRHASPRDRNNDAACLYPGQWGHIPGKEGQLKIKIICPLCSKRAAAFSENILPPVTFLPYSLWDTDSLL